MHSYLITLSQRALTICILALATAASAVADSFELAEYQLGRGLGLPNMNLVLSGYSNLRFHNLENGGARLELSDLSLFTIWKPSDRWLFFAEVEVEDLFEVGDGGISSDDAEVVVERLYIDYHWRRSVSVRAGRYLTPFGRWNLVHADPLVWTVTRPLVTTLTIPDHGTGVALFGHIAHGENSYEYYVYLDDSDDLDPHGDTSVEGIGIPGISNDFRQAAGARLVYHFFDDRAELGASYASFRLDKDSRLRHAFGVNGFLRWRRMEFSTEAAYRITHEQLRREEWGAFVQAVVPIRGNLYGFNRIEFFSSRKLGRDGSRVSLGLAYRPQPAMTFKLEYHDGSDRRLTADGVEAAWSVLF